MRARGLFLSCFVLVAFFNQSCRQPTSYNLANEKDPKSSTYKPTAPSNFTAQISPDYLTISLSWQDNSEAETGFILYKRKESEGGFYKLAEPSENEESFVDSLDEAITSAVIYRLVSVSDTTQSESQDIRVIASYPLEINIIGEGSVTEESISMKINDYEFGSVVRLIPIPDSTSVFINWQGDVDDETEVIEILVNAPKSVTATFDRKFKLMENGVTVDCSLAENGDTGKVKGIIYTKRRIDEITSGNASTTCTSGIANMSNLFNINDSGAFSGDISTWDVSNVTNMRAMFYGQTNFNSDLSAWDVSSVTNMNQMFSDAISFDGDLSSWNVSKVRDMQLMFARTNGNFNLSSWNVSSVTNMEAMFNNSKFNEEIDSWDVSNVTNMNFMFAGSDFNQPINSWDVSKVRQMYAMFSGSTFDQALNEWNVSNVETMTSMFRDTDFNQDINSWDVSSVSSMQSMFLDAKVFNLDISSWNITSVNDMRLMFQNAITFNQDIGNWDVYNADLSQMFYGATSFNQDLSNWCTPLSEMDYAYSFRYGSALTPENMPNWGCTRN